MTRVLPARLLALFVVALAAMGVLAWWTMPRQEDPSLPARWGRATVAWPGADPGTLERLVVDPIERHLAEVEDVDLLLSRASPGGVVFGFELAPDLPEPDETWDRIDEALSRAARELPDGAGPIGLDRDTNDQDALVIAVTGSEDLVALRRGAHELRRRLLASSDVAQVRLVGDPGEQVTIDLDETQARRLGLDATGLAALLAARHTTAVAGVVDLGPRRATIQPSAEFRDLEALRRTPIAVPGGATVPLGAIAKVRSTTAHPALERAWHLDAPAVFVGVVLHDGVDVVAAGDRVRTHLQREASALAPLHADVVLYQPDQVQARLADLQGSLALGMLIVTAVMVVTMGVRLGLIVGSVVPLIALGSLALYAALGGVLHQVSIAAFVISLGIVVDNAIVVAESVQAGIDAGEPAALAARRSPRELLVPLGAATGTTLAGFLPIALSSGTTADFIRDLPVVLLLTLVASYVFAIVVTPTACAVFLRRRGAGQGPRRWAAFTEGLGRLAWRHAWAVVLAAAVTVIGAGIAARNVDDAFFPESDRGVVIVDVTLPEGTRLPVVAELARRLDRAIRPLAEGMQTSTFVGRAAPHFYYNLPEWPQSPHRAQIVVQTPPSVDAATIVEQIRELADEPWLADAQLAVSPLRQGPPVSAPIEIRVSNGSLEELVTVAAAVRAELAGIEGAVEVRTDASLGAPVVTVDIDPASAAVAQVSPEAVTESLRAATLGVPVGQLRAGPDPIPIVVGHGTTHSPQTLMGTEVLSRDGDGRPLSSVASLGVRWRPAIVRHRNRQRVVTVMAGVAAGYTVAAVRDAIATRLDDVVRPERVSIAFGGESEESSQANSSLGRVAPIGALVLIGCLIATFDSFRRAAIVLVTIPLSLAGIVPGLLLGDQPFGFMALLGVIALVGIVVNNAIVLIDKIDRLRRTGSPVALAVTGAVRTRARPILLTTATTVAGLVPLACSSSRLWPPLAWPMMTGLVASTALTLLVVPALYRLLCSRTTTPTNLPTQGNGQHAHSTGP